MFRSRSYEAELMDGVIDNEEAIMTNFKELVFINRYLGGPSHSYRAIRSLMRESGANHVADVGAGAGDFIDYLYQRRSDLRPALQLSAIDPMPQAKQFAEKTFSEAITNCNWQASGYHEWFDDGGEADIIHASLFCHHLTDEALIDFLTRANKAAHVAVVINDLHRHPLAYYSIKWLTAAFSRSRFTQHDAPLSVLRGFKRSDWEELLGKAGISSYSIQWKWAFRHLIVIHA